MRILLTAIAVAISFMGTADAQENCQLKQHDSIDITVTPNAIRFPITINGITESFALALHNANNYVDEDGAKKLGLGYQGFPKNFPETGSQPGVAATFQMGKNSARNIPFRVTPNSEKVKEKFTLGSNIFRNLDVELDIAQQKLNLFSPDHCPGNVVYWTKSGYAALPYKRLPYGFISVDMQLDDKPVRVGLGSTGNTSFKMKAFKRIFGLDETSPGMVFERTTETGIKVYRYPFKNLTLDGLSVTNPQISINDIPGDSDCGEKSANCTNSGDLILGLPTLSKLRLYFSEKERVVYVTPATAH